MLCESPDSRIYGELQSLNEALLGLIVAPEAGPEPLGMPPEVARRLRTLTADQLSFVAGTPLLLAGFVAPERRDDLDRIADAEVPAGGYHDSRVRGQWNRSVRLFAAALLTWLWKTGGDDHLLTALSVGTGTHVPRLGVAEIERLAARATDRLRVRFGGHPRFWPDLVAAARSGDAQLRAVARLSALQLVLAEERSSAAGPG